MSKKEEVKKFLEEIKEEMNLPKMVDLKVKTEEFLPDYKTEMSAGIDLNCFNEEDIIIKPKQTVKIPTGLKVEIPEGFFGAIYPRSSTGIKKHLMLSNTVGIIDSDYRGEIKLFVYNYGDSDVVVKKGDRLAQMIIQPYLRVKVTKVDQLSQTKRGEGGFGSTGR